MTSQELFYVQVTSGNIDELFNGADPYLFDDADRRYIDPEQFNAALQSTNPNLWIIELRQAIDLLTEYQSKCGNAKINGYKVKDIFTMSKRCMLILANQYCPGDIQELTARAAISDNDVTPCPTIPTDVRAADAIRDNAESTKTSKPKRKSPAKSMLAESLAILKSEQAQAIFRQLYEAGFLDSDYKPISEKQADIAFMAKAIGRELFNITNWGVSFRILWFEKANQETFTQYERRGITAHCKEDILTAPKNSLNRNQAAFICALAKAIETIGINSFGSNSTRAQSMLELAKRNGYTSTK